MDINDFTETLQDKVEDYLGEIEVIGERFAFPLSLQHAGTYVGQRLALIGDAAHGIHPIAGQGFNLGMGDIEVLRDELLAAFDLGQTAGEPRVLKRYEKHRKLENGQMVVMTDLLVWLFSNSVPGLQGLRRAGLGIVQQIPPLRRFFMRRAMGIKRAA